MASSNRTNADDSDDNSDPENDRLSAPDSESDWENLGSENGPRCPDNRTGRDVVEYVRSKGPRDDHMHKSEAHRRLVVFGLQTFRFAHNVDWEGLKKYCEKQQKRYPNDVDISVLSEIFQMRRNFLNDTCDLALQKLDQLEPRIGQTASANVVKMAYLSEKAFFLYVSKDTENRKQANIYRHEARQCSEVNTPSTISCYNNYLYTVHNILRFTDWGFQGPPEDTWRQAETEQRTICLANRKMVEDIKETCAEKESDKAIANVFYIRSAIQLVQTLLRAKSLGGKFYAYRRSGASEESLKEADTCLRDIDELLDEDVSFRTKIQVCITRADYHIQKSVRLHAAEQQAELRLAKDWIGKVEGLKGKYIERKMIDDINNTLCMYTAYLYKAFQDSPESTVGDPNASARLDSDDGSSIGNSSYSMLDAPGDESSSDPNDALSLSEFDMPVVSETEHSENEALYSFHSESSGDNADTASDNQENAAGNK